MEDARFLGKMSQMPLNSANWDRFIKDQPISKNIDDRRDENIGLLEPGNIDLNNRPVVKNKDGSISTIRSISISTDKGTVLIPTVIGDKVVSNKEAIKHYKETGQHLGIFAREDDANAYAEWLHQQQASQYLNKK